MSYAFRRVAAAPGAQVGGKSPPGRSASCATAFHDRYILLFGGELNAHMAHPGRFLCGVRGGAQHPWLTRSAAGSKDSSQTGPRAGGLTVRLAARGDGSGADSLEGVGRRLWKGIGARGRGATAVEGNRSEGASRPHAVGGAA